MVRRIEGTLDGAGLKIAIVQARFNDLITNKLAEGALDGLLRHGVAEDDILVTRPADRDAVLEGGI